MTGHTRLKAAIKLKMKEVPVIRLDDLTDEQVKAFRLVDNKTAEIADWDMDALIQELNEIEMDLSMFDLEIDDDDIVVVEDDYDVVVPEEPISKRGDIWQLGRHRLMCGDSTSIDDVNKLMNGERADMVFTDPPYNVAFTGRSGNFDVIKNDDLSEDEFEDFINATISIIKYINAPIHYIWCNWKFYGILQGKLDYKSCIVWAKNVFGLGKGYRHQHEFCLFNGEIDENIKNESDLWEIAKDTNYVHPTQKPIALCGRALGNHKDVNNVIDLFGGSGSTLMACEQLNRISYMMELDPRYVDVIIKRWEDYTGLKAEKIN